FDPSAYGASSVGGSGLRLPFGRLRPAPLVLASCSPLSALHLLAAPASASPSVGSALRRSSSPRVPRSRRFICWRLRPPPPLPSAPPCAARPRLVFPALGAFGAGPLGPGSGGAGYLHRWSSPPNDFGTLC